MFGYGVLGDVQEARVSAVMGTREACAVGGEECAHVSARMSFARTSQEFAIAQGPTPTFKPNTKAKSKSSFVTSPALSIGTVFTLHQKKYSKQPGGRTDADNVKCANPTCARENSMFIIRHARCVL